MDYIDWDVILLLAIWVGAYRCSLRWRHLPLITLAIYWMINFGLRL
jgi:hypothetical protein